MQTLANESRGVAQHFWQGSLVRGIVAIIFGILAIVWPHLTFRLFFLIFGIFAIVEGVVLCINAFAHRKMSSQISASSYQGRSFYQRADPGATYGQRTEPSQGGTTYGQTGPAQGGTPYQQAEPFQGGTGYGQTEPAQGAASYQRSERAQGGADYQPAQGAASYGRPEATRGGMAFRAPSGTRSWGISLVEGLLTIIAGILCLILPTFVAALAIYVVAAWAMFKGIGAFMQIPHHGWIMGLIGALAIIMSLFLFIDPIGAIRTFLWGIGVFALIMGVLLVVRALQHNASLRHAAPPPEPSY